MATDLIIAGEEVSRTAALEAFPMRVVEGCLMMPSHGAEFMGNRNVRSGRGFLSYLRATPEGFQHLQGWNAAKTELFTQRLQAALEQALPELPAGALAPRPPVRRSLGARDPSQEPA